MYQLSLNDIAIIIGTGPSITPAQLETAKQLRAKGAKLYGMNHIWMEMDVDSYIACNIEYYDLYWEQGLKDYPAEKWTWHKPTADKYGLNYIEGRWGDGFSKEYLHLGHSSGFQAPGLAYRDGIKTMLLIGYDMCYAPDYNGRQREIGSKPRHYFGEYPEQLQHWPSVKVKNGQFVELIEQFEKVKQINTDIEIINCTPGSAMTCFEFGKLEGYL